MGLFPADVEVALAGIPVGPNSNVYIVDPVNGDDDNAGTKLSKPLLTIAAAYAKCVTNQNDVVLLVGGPTANSPDAAIVWEKDYTHLVGLSAPLAMGQRCRITNTAANDLAVLFTLSGDGCIVKNVQFFDGKDKDEDSACLLVSGDRNYFENVFVAGMGHATPAARAGSYGVTVSGSENRFKDCEIGIDTIVRTAANSELIVSGVRNRFEHCVLRSYTKTAGKFLATIDASAADLRDVIFDDCLFFNYSDNWASGAANVFQVKGANTHWVILRGCQLVGTGLGWADVVTHVYADGAQPNAGFGISTNPTT